LFGSGCTTAEACSFDSIIEKRKSGGHKLPLFAFLKRRLNPATFASTFVVTAGHGFSSPPKPKLDLVMIALRISEAAKAVSIPERHLRAAIKSGELNPRAVGRRSVLLISELEQWLKNRPRTKSSLGEAVHA
jgi:excisionase family DNA binding protein